MEAEELAPLPRNLMAVLMERWTQAVADGTPMPSEPLLAAESGASRPTVREALIRLEERGYIYRTQGSGTAPNVHLQHVQARLDQQQDHSDVIRELGAEPHVRVIRHEHLTVDDVDARKFGVEVGTRALRTVKVWTSDGTPVAMAVDTIPYRRSTVVAEVDVTQPVFDLAEQLNGVRVTWETVRPTAVSLDPVEAWLLSRPKDEASLALALHGFGIGGVTGYWSREVLVTGTVDYALVRTVKRS